MRTRTQEEIVAKISEVQGSDYLGTKTGDLVFFLDYSHAKKYLKSGTTEEEWNELREEPTRRNITAIMEDYMEFAWDKANNCRGISASRTMEHYAIWLWLMGDEMAEKFNDLEDYCFYGKDNLVAICEEFGWDSSKWDDGVRSDE